MFSTHFLFPVTVEMACEVTHTNTHTYIKTVHYELNSGIMHTLLQASAAPKNTSMKENLLTVQNNILHPSQRNISEPKIWKRFGSVCTCRASFCNLDAPWIERREKRSLKCPRHCISTPALPWMTWYSACSGWGGEGGREGEVSEGVRV